MRTALLLSLAGIPLRVGFRQSRGWFLYHATVNRDASRHDIDRNLSLLESLGISPEDCQKQLQLQVSSNLQDDVVQLFRSLGINGQKTIIGINAGSVWPTKRWSADGYGNLIIQLKRDYDCDVVLFGAPEDSAIVSQIHKICGGAAVSVVGKVGLRQLPAALGVCDLLVTNDSGPMHIAVARGIPVVSIFCATTPSLGFYPYSSRAVVVEKNLPCRPCTSHGGRRCPLGTEDCIRLIGVTDVMHAIESLLPLSNSRQTVVDSPQPQFLTL